MRLANDLNGLITKFGPAMAAAAEKSLIPLHRPGVDAMPDLSAVEHNRSRLSRQTFTYFPSQLEKIAAAVKGLQKYRRTWLIAEMGSGKSPMSLGAAWTLFAGKKFTALVLCPGHLVRKWRREIEWAIPGVLVKVIRNFNDLVSWHRDAAKHRGPAFAVISKETAKLGFDVDRPCCARRRLLQTDTDVQESHRVTVHDVATCPTCGTMQTEKKGDQENPLLYQDYLNAAAPIRCRNCGDRLSTGARGFRNGPHLDRYIQRKMRRFFDLLIADEVHELAGSDTIQGNTFGTLSSACKFTLALTGTLIGGHARDLHAPLWRMSPQLLRQRGFDLHPLRGGQVGAIGRNARSFISHYGVLEHQVVRGVADDFTGRVRRGACGRKREYKTDERPRPGISPDLYNHFLIGRGVFMSLSELGPALPSLERILEPCSMSDELRQAYRKIDADMEAAIKQKANKGKGPPVLATIRIQALDAYADKPWEWSPITCPDYDEQGRRSGNTFITQPADLGENHADGKDRRLVEICRAELKGGRRCCVYVTFTGKHDVRPKVQQLLKSANLRAVIMPDTVQPIAREDWIAKHLDEMDVLIVHPKRVMTGLDLIAFPSLIFYQLGYSTHVLRQAGARARRPTQRQVCKIYFLYYQNTIQEWALALMGEKEAASQALEGTFDVHALRGMMNGGDNDDIVAALANSLESGRNLDAKSAWNPVKSQPVAVAPVQIGTVLTRPPSSPRPSIPETTYFDFAD
jgi:hypothetical protein